MKRISFMIESEPRYDCAGCWRWKVSYGPMLTWTHGYRTSRFTDGSVHDQAQVIARWRMRVGAL